MQPGFEDKKQKAGFIIICVFSLLPGAIIGGIMPAWNVLPLWGWVLIATGGGLLGGFVATPFRAAGPLGGALGGAGALFGVWGYVAVRSLLSHTFYAAEIAVGGLLGALPGYLVFRALRRRDRPSPD